MSPEKTLYWSLYVLIAIIIILSIHICNSWNVERDMRNRNIILNYKLEDCASRHIGCLENSITLQERTAKYEKIIRASVMFKSKFDADFKESKDKVVE